MQFGLFQANNEAIVLINSVEALAKSANSPFRSQDAYNRRLAAISGKRLSSAQKSGEFVTNTGEFPAARESSHQSPVQKPGESVAKSGEFQHLFATNSPDLGQFGQVGDEMGESVASVSLSDYISLDKITYNKGLTMNDKTLNDSPTYKDPRPIEAIHHDAADLAERLDGKRDSRWFPRFVKSVKNNPPHVRRLAEIDALYHSAFPDYRGKPGSPGSWFFRRCDEYADPEYKVKDEIRQWNESGMDIVSIHLELQRGRRVPAAAMLPFVSEPDASSPELSRDGQETSVSLGERHTVATWQEKREVAQHSLLNTKMDQDQARTLCNQIRQEIQAFCEQMRAIGQELDIQAEVYEGERPGEYVVGTVWDGNEEDWLNAAAWNRYFEQVKKCYLR